MRDEDGTLHNSHFGHRPTAPQTSAYLAKSFGTMHLNWGGGWIASPLVKSHLPCARVAKLADAGELDSPVLQDVQVRILSWARQTFKWRSLSDWNAVHQPLAFRALDRLYSSLSISRFAMIPTERKFIAVAMQVTIADVVKAAHDAAL